MVDRRKVSEMERVTSLPSGGLVPVVANGQNYAASVDLFQGPLLDVTDYGASTTATGAVNDAAITAAVAAAAAAAADLWWPPGVYTSAASIPLLHTVRHRGPGAIRRGSDTFYLEPRRGLTNRLYVATTGSASNDGLTSSQPLATAAGLFSVMANYGPILDGTWQGIFAAGTYATLNATFDTPSRNLVTIKGPSAGGIKAVPAAIFSGTGSGSSDFGMRASGPGVQVYWQDLKFINYSNVSTENIALLCDYGADLWTYNVHVASTTGNGIYGEDCQVVRITGGIIDGCKRGILLNACNMVTVGYTHATNADGEIKNCTQAGVEWSRGTNGHLDYMTLTSNVVALDVMHVSRCHVQANAFTTNTVAIRARSGASYFDDTNVGLTNTYTGNTENWQNFVGSGESDSDFWLSIAERRRGYSANGFTHTGTVVKTTLVSPWTIPQNFFITPSANASKKKIRIKIHGIFTTAGALSKIGVDFDSVQIDQLAAVAPGANTVFTYEVEIWADGNAAQYRSSRLTQNGVGVNGALGSTAQNMATSERTVNITAQLANAGDSLQVTRTEVWVSG